MSKIRVIKRAASAFAVVSLLAFSAQAGTSANGAGSLYVAGATHTPTHWNVVLGSTVTAEIRGVSTSEVGDPLPATLTVYVKSSVFGNTTLTATQIGSSSDYTFTYTPPTTAVDGYDACGTTIVSYVAVGLNSNNDFLDDDLQNGSVGTACGFRFLDSTGLPVSCTLGVEPQPWGSVKQLYR
jgi:hypothetical protein